MPESKKLRPGTIGWVDLTVPEAEVVRRFYEVVTGWKAGTVDMGGYSDYTTSPPDGGAPVAGVCHRRGANAALPSVWMIYITVSDLKASLEQCRRLGGKVLVEHNSMGGGSRYAIIEDPAGAVCALFQAATRANAAARRGSAKRPAKSRPR